MEKSSRVARARGVSLLPLNLKDTWEDMFQSKHLNTLTEVFLGCFTEAVELVAVCSLLAIRLLLPCTKRPKGAPALTYMGIASGCGQLRGQEITCLVSLLC